MDGTTVTPSPASAHRFTGLQRRRHEAALRRDAGGRQHLLHLAPVDRPGVADDQRLARQVAPGDAGPPDQPVGRRGDEDQAARARSRACRGRAPRCGRSAARRRPRRSAAPRPRAPRRPPRTPPSGPADAPGAAPRRAAGRASPAPRRRRSRGAAARRGRRGPPPRRPPPPPAAAAPRAAPARCPAAVGRSGPERRTNRSVPTSRSSERIRPEMVGCRTPSRSAARDTPPCSSTARNATSRRVGMIVPSGSIGTCLC